MRLWTAGLTAVALAISAAILQPARAAGTMGLTVTGPIAASVRAGDPTHDYPFYASIVDLAGKGYVEQEFFIEGTANRYETPADAKVRADLDVKVWKLLSETDVLGQQAANRQPDTKNFRTWEVAGDSHVDVQFRSYSRQLSDRDGGPVAPGFSAGLDGRGAASPATSAAAAQGAPGATLGASPCERPPYSHVPFYQVMNAAFDHLVRWVKDGTPPPSAPPIDVSSAGPPAVAVRDKAGNALGGIRLAEHAVPTGVNTGVNSGPGFCRLYGSHEDFDAGTLASLYPTHAAYVAAVKDVTEKNVKAGYILKVDGDLTIATAENSKIGALE